MTTIEFFSVNYDERNLPLDGAAVRLALSSTKVGQVTFADKLVLPTNGRGAFEITQSQFATLFQGQRRSRYIRIRNQNAQGAALGLPDIFAFITSYESNQTESVSVFYTVDDWTTFYLGNDNAEIVGNVTRFNYAPYVKLGDDYKIRSSKDFVFYPPNFRKKDKALNETPLFIDSERKTQTLPTGCKIALIFYKKRQYNGNDWVAQPTAEIYSQFSGNAYDSGRLINVIPYYNGRVITSYLEASSGSRVRLTDSAFTPNSAQIDKIVFIDYVPFPASVGRLSTTSGGAYEFLFSWTGTNQQLSLSDLYTYEVPTSTGIVTERGYSQYVSRLYLERKYTLPADDDYYHNQIYSFPESQNKTFSRVLGLQRFDVVYGAAAYTLPQNKKVEALYIGLAADGESAYIIPKFQGEPEQTPESSEGTKASIILPTAMDYQAYRNAKVSGALGITSGVIGSIGSIVAGVATENPIGIIAGVAGIAQNAEKAYQLSKLEQYGYPSSIRDDVTERILKLDAPKGVVYVPTGESENLYKFVDDFGVQYFCDWNDAEFQRRYSKFKYVEADIQVLGVPVDVAENIRRMFLTGLTLWTTAENVGKKTFPNIAANPST